MNDRYVSGSDDMNEWFTIAENISLQNHHSNNNDRYIQLINFPHSSYRYFKLTIHNGKNDALNIIEAWINIIPDDKITYNYTINPPCAFVQVDSSDHISYIKVHQPAFYHIDKINLKIKGPRFFKRETDVLINNHLSNFTISSDSIFSFYLPAFNEKDWLIRIFNGDNPPLQLKDITVEQEAKKIIAYLEAGKSYHLPMNDSLARRPDYDLSQFRDSIPAVTPSLKILPVENNSLIAEVSTEDNFKKWLCADNCCNIYFPPGKRS